MIDKVTPAVGLTNALWTPGNAAPVGWSVRLVWLLGPAARGSGEAGHGRQYVTRLIGTNVLTIATTLSAYLLPSRSKRGTSREKAGLIRRWLATPLTDAAGNMPGARSDALQVLHLGHTVEHGGAELALRRLLASDGRTWSAEVSVPAPGERLDVFSGLSSFGVAVTPTGVPQLPGAIRGGVRVAPVAWGVLRQAFAIRASGMLGRADIVHANTSRSALFGAIAMLGTRTPLVVHLRDRVEPEALGRIGYAVFRSVVSRRATAYIANSESTAATVRGSLRRGQTLMIIPSPSGVGRVSAPAAAGDGPVRIGMVARLAEWKGQHLVIRAFAQACLDGLATLTFFGDASFGDQAYADSLPALARDLGLHGVYFAGFTDDVAEAIDSLDIAVQYSLRPEPLGQNVLQYLARGRAVVTASEGGPADWIGDGVNGLLVAPRDPAALGRALRALVEDPARRDALASGALATPGLATDTAIAAAHGDYFRAVASSAH